MADEVMWKVQLMKGKIETQKSRQGPSQGLDIKGTTVADQVDDDEHDYGT